MNKQNQVDMAGLELIVDTLRVGAKKPGDAGESVSPEGGDQTYEGKKTFTDGINTKQVSSAAFGVPGEPTAAELTAAFGSAADLGPGFIGIITTETEGVLAFTDALSWYYLHADKAV